MHRVRVVVVGDVLVLFLLLEVHLSVIGGVLDILFLFIVSVGEYVDVGCFQ